MDGDGLALPGQLWAFSHTSSPSLCPWTSLGRTFYLMAPLSDGPIFSVASSASCHLLQGLPIYRAEGDLVLYSVTLLGFSLHFPWCFSPFFLLFTSLLPLCSSPLLFKESFFKQHFMLPSFPCLRFSLRHIALRTKLWGWCGGLRHFILGSD